MVPGPGARVVSDELDEVVLAVLQFVDRRRPDIERARLRDTERPLAHIEDHPLAASDAILAETAMLLYLASRCPVSVATRRTLDGVAAWVSPLVRSPRAAQILARLPYTALSSIGEAHVLLSRSGCTDHDFDDVWRTALNAPEASAVERPPHRLIGRAWLSGLGAARGRATWTRFSRSQFWPQRRQRSILPAQAYTP
jgi:hypothetical protein